MTKVVQVGFDFNLGPLRGLQLGRGEKKFGRGEASAYTHFTPDEPIAYTERIHFTPDKLGPGRK